MIEIETQRFLEDLAAAGISALHALSPEELRAAWVKIQSIPVGKPPALIVTKHLPIGPRGTVRIRIVRPRHGGEALPVILYCAGGGWAFGDPDTHDRLVREIAQGVHAAVVLVDYARAPENRFPVALEEIHAVACHVAEQAAALNLDGSRLAIAGDGAGGNLAAATALLAKQRRGPRLSFQALFYPIVAAGFDTPSYAAFRDGPWLTADGMRHFWDGYLPDRAARANPLATPLSASRAELSSLPDALVITAENDVVRDEGEAYAERLAEAGVRVTAARFNGTIHGFMSINPLSDTPATRGAIAQATGALRAALHGA